MVTQPPDEAIPLQFRTGDAVLPQKWATGPVEAQRRTDRSGTDEILAAALGWFSIAIGLAEISAPPTRFPD